MSEVNVRGLLLDGPLAGLEKGSLGRYVLIPGDPDRCSIIAEHFDEPVRLGRSREFELWTGWLHGEPVVACSSGIGGPSTAIAMEELAPLGVDTFIRVGTSGAVRCGPRPGDLAIVCGAVRDEGASLEYLPVEFPAVADLDVVFALRAGARELGHRYHVGIAQSKDSFYGEVEAKRMPVAPRLARRWNAWQRGGVVCSEMEAATMFAVAATRRLRAGGIMLVDADGETDGELAEDERRSRRLQALVETSIAGLKHLIANDGAQRAARWQ